MDARQSLRAVQRAATVPIGLPRGHGADYRQHVSLNDLRPGAKQGVPIFLCGCLMINCWNGLVYQVLYAFGVKQLDDCREHGNNTLDRRATIENQAAEDQAAKSQSRMADNCVTIAVSREKCSKLVSRSYY